ncbi:unnamed protein product [Protopolystoma xenopodis]|uniref:Peptidase S54 rhomboid domain-containing protein n=1 Tax=Protopolystoma xenopodis TaxID=117903 RepID=A0A448XGZ7_9PLAT|nr:unnamed protein product [Protopolystoma xenopodis]
MKDKTTITKCCLACIVICSFILHLPFSKKRGFFVYDLDDMLLNYSFWRLIPSKLVFLDINDLIFGSLLLYYFRIFERRYGPRKFILCGHLYCIRIIYGFSAQACAAISTALELFMASVLRRFSFRYQILPSGPYSIIFPFFVPYFFEIPRVPVAYIVGIPITGKSFPYIFGLQVASSSPESMLVCLCGLVSCFVAPECLIVFTQSY